MGRGAPARSRSAASASSPSGRVSRWDSTRAAATAITITAAPSPRTRAWVSGSATTIVGTPTTSTAATVRPTMVSRSRRRMPQPPASVTALEPEPDPAHGRDEAGAVRVVAELAAEPGDVHVQGLGRGPPLGVPDLAHDLLAGDHLAGVPEQDPEQIELLGGELQLGVPVPGPAGLRVDAEPHHHRVVGGAPAEQRPDPGQQLGQPERLCHGVGSAGVPPR